MFIFKAGPQKVFRLKPVRCAKKVADPCPTRFFNINLLDKTLGLVIVTDTLALGIPLSLKA